MSEHKDSFVTTAEVDTAPLDDVPVVSGADELRTSPTASLETSKLRAQLQQAAQIIKSLFGNVVEVVGVFSCSVARQSGRMYVSTEGLFFYSNLFGFEKKICVRYEDAVELTTYRSTSVYVRTSNGDEHVIKSFQDRDLVYNLISRYCPCIKIDPIDDILPESKEVETRDLSDRKMSDLRATSDNSISGTDSESESNSIVQSELPEMDKLTIWEAIKRLSNDWDSSVTNMKLPLCKISDFFDLFLADNAPHSLCTFHQKIMGDKNVEIGVWCRDDANESAANSDESFSRTVRFEHKSKVSVAQVKRDQTYRSYGKNSCMKNVTNLSGVPQAETFFVEDFWIMEQCDGGIVLNVKYRITFSKNTFLKSIIESRARSELLEWYGKYTSFLKDAIAGVNNTAAAVDESPVSIDTPCDSHINLYGQPIRLFLLFCLVTSALYLYILRLKVVELEKLLINMQSRMLDIENQCLLGTEV